MVVTQPTCPVRGWGNRVGAEGDDGHPVVGEPGVGQVAAGGLRRADHPVGSPGVSQPGLKQAPPAAGGRLGVIAPCQVVDGGYQGSGGGRNRSPGGVDEVRTSSKSVDTGAACAMPCLVEHGPGQA